MKCPYCGAETTSHRCEYCDSDLSYLYTNHTTINDEFSKDINNIPYGYRNTGNPQTQANASNKNKNVALILCIIGFFGVNGLHRFYTGHILTGLL
ncbi:MAG: TM2 domain-containing protein [Ruminococcus flavefaciens]|nr:TM2 domain-containing protein [Ruminococcus flavefaciens]